MDHAVSPVHEPLRGRACVPPSKSFLQRALVLRALSAGPIAFELFDAQPGDDVKRTEAALDAIGPWQAAHLGATRTHRRLDLGWNGTGFRFLTATACLRPPGARTLIGGRPELLRRPHRALRRALVALGAHVRRRGSGAFRVIAQPLRSGRVQVDGSASAQYASALASIAPRIGGLDIELTGPVVVSRPYLRITVQVLRQFGIDAALDESSLPVRLHVGAGSPARTDVLAIEPDASAAAAWFSAAAYAGGSQSVLGLRRDSVQADAAIFDILARMGARVDEDDDGWCRVTGSGEPLQAPGRVDLRDATDLVPLVGALAAAARGKTQIVGAGHARHKESDRLARVAQHIVAMGGHATLDAQDVLHIEGRSLRGAALDVRDDHRLAFAFGVLGLRVPGVILRGAESTNKSDPRFLHTLDALAMTGQ